MLGATQQPPEKGGCTLGFAGAQPFGPGVPTGK